MRKTKKVYCGDVAIGGGSPITIQSMTNTDTSDVEKTVTQIKSLQDAGCEIVRVAVPDEKAAEAILPIKRQIQIPLIADIHFDYRLALSAINQGADKIRINPGNLGGEEKLRAVVSAAKKANIPIRIGVNAGSLEKEILARDGVISEKALVESALKAIRKIEEMDFENMVVSVKSSDVSLNYHAYRILSEKTNYPLHIGVTESGTPARGGMKSAAGLGALLLSGIGDTMRVSFTGDPVEEVLFAKELLKACGIRKEGINLISCPTCGRCRVKLADVVEKVENSLPETTKPMTIAIMGCEVNGPGEAKEADIGIAFGNKRAAIFRKGNIIKTVEEAKAVDELLALIE